MYALQKAIDEKEHPSGSSSVGRRSRDQAGGSMNSGTPSGDIPSLSEVN